jgi:hypothetical protein
MSRLERDVETARAKLRNDLARLRSPAAFDDFSESARDVIKASATSAWQTVVDNLKAKAAENPAATMAIGAGLAWRVFRHPPIATALIGAGLFSLLRTSSTRLRGRDDSDYLSHAKRRLRQQAIDLGSGVKDRASDLGTELKAEPGVMTKTIKERSEQLAGAASDKFQEWTANVEDVVRDAPNQAKSLARQLERTAHDQDVRDNFLLGIAGVAVFAALGAAYQRRSTD